MSAAHLSRAAENSAARLQGLQKIAQPIFQGLPKIEQPFFTGCPKGARPVHCRLHKKKIKKKREIQTPPINRGLFGRPRFGCRRKNETTAAFLI
jgi:hypothetical protein